MNASSTLTRCLAEVSIHCALNRFAKSRPSVYIRTELGFEERWGHTVRLNLSLILQITLVGNHNDGEEILVFHLLISDIQITQTQMIRTLRICWWNVLTSSKELRDVIE
jgi:hypothetical protein